MLNRTAVRTYDTELSSLHEQLKKYAELALKTTAAFSALEQGFDKVEKGMGTQAESIATLTKEIQRQLPDSLGELERTLSGLTAKFATDYQAFLDNYSNLVSTSRHQA